MRPRALALLSHYRLTTRARLALGYPTARHNRRGSNGTPVRAAPLCSGILSRHIMRAVCGTDCSPAPHVRRCGLSSFPGTTLRGNTRRFQWNARTYTRTARRSNASTTR
jgi:hypothetical protein